MSRSLIIPDVHNRFVRAQQIIDRVPHDKCILLGDYFDNFGDGSIEANNTAVWLRDVVLNDPRNVLLIGNHDAHYFWAYHYYLSCSGYSDKKRDAIVKELSRDHIEKFKFYHIDQGFLFTHAGLDNRIWKNIKMQFAGANEKSTLELVDKIMSHWVGILKHQLDCNQRCELLGAGWDRGGSQPVGGINWVDFSNLAPINGINQIVGHTPHVLPDVLIQKNGGAIAVKTIVEFFEMPKRDDHLSVNYALDTHSNHYMIIEDGEVQVWDYINNVNIKELDRTYIPESPMNFL